jgi:hypothetical protein
MLTLDERIEYWRGRARLARRFSLAQEATAATRIVEELRVAQRAQAKADKAVDRIVEAMPNELYEQEGN